MNLLDNELALTYFGKGECERWANIECKNHKPCVSIRILEAMEAPLKCGERYLFWHQGKITEMVWGYYMAHITDSHPEHLRLPDRFQPSKDKPAEKKEYNAGLEMRIHFLEKENARLYEALKLSTQSAPAPEATADRCGCCLSCPANTPCKCSCQRCHKPNPAPEPVECECDCCNGRPHLQENCHRSSAAPKELLAQSLEDQCSPIEVLYLDLEFLIAAAEREQKYREALEGIINYKDGCCFCVENCNCVEVEFREIAQSALREDGK